MQRQALPKIQQNPINRVATACDAIADTVADAVPVIQDPNAERTVAEAGFGAIVAATHLISLAARELQHVLIPDMSPIAVEAISE